MAWIWPRLIVKGIVNRIEVTSGSSTGDVRHPIVRALHRETELDARGIEVTVSGSTVILTGSVRSWHERESAERAAMHAPGITRVDNRITVAWPDDFADVEDEIC